MNKAIGYDGPCWGKDPFPAERQDRAYEQAFESIYQNCVSSLKRTGVNSEHKVSMLDVFDNMVLTGLPEEEQRSMIAALHTLYKYRPSLAKLIDEQIEYAARITAERELEK